LPFFIFVFLGVWLGYFNEIAKIYVFGVFFGYQVVNFDRLVHFKSCVMIPLYFSRFATVFCASFSLFFACHFSCFY